MAAAVQNLFSALQLEITIGKIRAYMKLSENWCFVQGKGRLLGWIEPNLVGFKTVQATIIEKTV